MLQGVLSDPSLGEWILPCLYALLPQFFRANACGVVRSIVDFFPWMRTNDAVP